MAETKAKMSKDKFDKVNEQLEKEKEKENIRQSKNDLNKIELDLADNQSSIDKLDKESKENPNSQILATQLKDLQTKRTCPSSCGGEPLSHHLSPS